MMRSVKGIQVQPTAQEWKGLRKSETLKDSAAAQHEPEQARTQGTLSIAPSDVGGRADTATCRLICGQASEQKTAKREQDCDREAKHASEALLENHEAFTVSNNF